MQAKSVPNASCQRSCYASDTTRIPAGPAATSKGAVGGSASGALCSDAPVAVIIFLRPAWERLANSGATSTTANSTTKPNAPTKPSTSIATSNAD